MTYGELGAYTFVGTGVASLLFVWAFWKFLGWLLDSELR